MRRSFILIVLCMGLCVEVFGDGRSWGGYGEDDKGRRRNDDGVCGDDGSCDDDERHLYEPCDYADDVECVRKFFGTYGQCSIVHHEDNKPLYVDRYTAYLPQVNMTIISTKLRLSNLNGRIVRFYVNKKTGNLVMSVDYKGIVKESKLGIFIVSRRGREPAIAKDILNVTYPITLTAVIPVNGGITIKALKESRVTAFSPQPVIPFYFGPKVTMSKDPAIARSYAGLVADIPTAIQEDLLNIGPSLFLAYLQKYICNFGVPLGDYFNIQSPLH